MSYILVLYKKFFKYFLFKEKLNTLYRQIYLNKKYLKKKYYIILVYNEKH